MTDVESVVDCWKDEMLTTVGVDGVATMLGAVEPMPRPGRFIFVQAIIVMASGQTLTVPLRVAEVEGCVASN